MAGGVSVAGNRNVSVLHLKSNLTIRNVVFHNSDVEDEAVSEVNMIYASQVTQHAYIYACMFAFVFTHMHVHPYTYIILWYTCIHICDRACKNQPCECKLH